MRFNLPQCHECKKTTTGDNIIRLVVDSKKGKAVDICKKCFPKVYGKFLKEAQMTKEARNSHYYKEGARDVDFKSYIEKWAKKLAR